MSLVSTLKKFWHWLSCRFVAGDMNEILKIISEQGIVMAIHYLKTKHSIFRPAYVRFLINFYEYLALHLQSLPLFQEKDVFLIHFCCWGESYAGKVEKYFLPSLLAQGNLPAVSIERKIILLIHCDKITQKRLLNSSVLRAIEKYAEVNFFIFPESVMESYKACVSYPDFFIFKKINETNSNLKYYFLGGLQTLALQIGLLNRCYISFMMPDFLLSDNFFTQGFLKLQDKKVVALTTFRTDYHKICHELEKFYVPEEASLTIQADFLAGLQIENMHPAAKSRVVAETVTNFSPTAQLIFESLSGVIVRTFHYHPILVNCAKIEYLIETDFSPIDNSGLNQILLHDVSYEQQIWVCDDSSIMVMMELSEPGVEQPSRDCVTRNKGFTYTELLMLVRNMISSSPQAFDQPLNQYFISIQNHFKCSMSAVSDHVVKKNIISDELFFADLAKNDSVSGGGL